jgi:signal transduction histidine kinase
VRVHVADTGLRAEPTATNGGSGLRGMRERAAVYSGIVQAGPRPDGGWQVEAQLPLAPQNGEEELA